MTSKTVDVALTDLSGVALDYAVAVAEQLNPNIRTYGKGSFYVVIGPFDLNYYPHSNWSHAGPIIDRDISRISNTSNGLHVAVIEVNDEDGFCRYIESGKTYLEAVCRCYVASKLGPTVAIPAVLMDKGE